MILDRVTITGADDSIRPDDLIPLARDFPFVEWGILFSGRRLGLPRYPSRAWLSELGKLMWHVPMKLSAHLCGRWVRDLVTGAKFTWRDEHKLEYDHFQRVQLNFHGEFHRRGSGFETILSDESPRAEGHGMGARDGKQFILQCDGVNDHAAEEIVPWCNAVPLFDRSGGAGVLPKEWPKAWPGVYCGYAGGLGPDNLAEQLDRIELAAGGEHVWIDMERRVRSEDDSRFDLEKVRRVLETAAPWVRGVRA
jgi:hypothetical protein